MNPERKTASLSLAETKDMEYIPDKAEQTVQEKESVLFSGEIRESEGFSGNASSAKEERFKVTEEGNAISNVEQSAVPKLNISDSSAVDNSDSDVNEETHSRPAPDVSFELEDLKERYEKLTKDRNSMQQKLFEMQSEFCSVEIERDLEKETARYLEEQLSSLNSSLSLKENEILSLRKRYKLLNEGFLNSESLREGLERDVSRMTGVVRELEERLELSEEMLKDNKGGIEIKARRLNIECDRAEGNAKLDAEVVKLNEILEKERNAKRGLEEIFENVEKERNLLLKEIEELRDEYQNQRHEVDVLRDLLHEKKKEDQLQQHEEQQLQRQLEQKRRDQTKEIRELRQSRTRLSNKISLLEDENKKLEDELYQQLTVLEKLENENKSYAVARKELQEITKRLKIVGFSTVEQLVVDYSVLQESKHQLETKVNQLENEISNCQRFSEKTVNLESHSANNPKASLPLGENCTKSSCVPRSQYLKQKFQLKSLTEEVNALKQASRHKVVKEKFVTSCSKQEHRSWKHENKIAKKWLKTIKDSMNAVIKEDNATEQCGIVMLENKLHEANIRVEDLLHELEFSKKENEVLVSTNREQKNQLEVLKRRLDEIQDSQTSLLEVMKTKLEQAEQKFKDELQIGNQKGEKIVSLEEKNEEMCIEFEKLKVKLQSLLKEKEKNKNELELLKHDVLKNFGSLNLQSVSKSLATAKQMSSEYVKIIERNKDNVVKLTQDLNSLQQVNTILREELSDARMQLEKKDEIISKKYLSESISEKLEADRLHAILQAFESSKQNEKELLAMYTKQKQEWKKLQEQLMSLHSELEETKVLLSEKEKECEITKHMMRELEATCEVYEEEFENSIAIPVNDDLHVDLHSLSSDENQKDDLSESGSDSTAENFREMQEALQERMITNVERLQNRLKETLAAVSSCQELNITLQRRLHAAEKKNLESENVDSRTPDKEFLQEILNKLAENEQQIHEMLNRNSADLAHVNREDNSKYTINEMPSTQKEIIKQLKIDNTKNEVSLVEAYEKIAKLEEELEMCQSYRDCNFSTAEMVENGVVFFDESNENTNVLAKNDENNFGNEYVSTTTASNKNTTDEGDNLIATNVNLKEELDCMTAKYANLKASFEGCLRRLKVLEAENDCNKVETAINESNIAGKKFAEEYVTVQEEDVVPPCTAERIPEFTTALQQVKSFGNYCEAQTYNGSPLSKISCSFLESDTESNDIGSDRMVIELTLTENEIDSLEGLGTCEDFVQERLEFEKELSHLRAKIIEQEKLNSKITNENYRIIQFSFKERADLENKIGALQDLSAMIKEKLKAVEVERDSLQNRAHEAEIKRLEAKHELEHVQHSTLKEKQIFVNTIEGLKDQEKAIKNQVIELETEKTELRRRVEVLQGEVQDCSKETQRVKVESYNEGEKYKNIFNELEREIEVYKKEKESKTSQILELKELIRLLEDEIRKCKTSQQEQIPKHEDIVKKLEDVILNLEEENKGLKYENSDALQKYRDLQDTNEILTKNLELNIASVRKEKKSLESKIIQYKTTINMLEENLVVEKKKNDDFILKTTTENEEPEIRLLGERKTFQDTIKQLQEKILILKKEIEDLNIRKENSVSMVKVLEDKIDLLNEERHRTTKTLLDEKQILEDATSELQITTTKLKETFVIENVEKDKKILALQKENEALLDESQKLTVNEKKVQDKVLILEKRIEDLNLENDTMESRIKELSSKVCLLNDENAQEKAYWLDDKESLEMTIEKLQYTIATMEEKFKEKIEEDIATSKVRRENVEQTLSKRLQEAILKLEKMIEIYKGENENEALKTDGSTNVSEVGKVSLLTDVRNLDITINHLYEAILVLEETVEKEMLSCKSLLSKLSEENEHNIACSLNVRKQFEDQLEELQDDVRKKEKEIREQKSEIGMAGSKINSLESQLAANREENAHLKHTFSSEKQSLEDEITNLQTSMNIMENDVKEKVDIAKNSELKVQQTISALEVVNQSLKIENGTLKTQVEGCVEEILRIKSLSFNERQKWEVNVKNIEDISLSMENIMNRDKDKMQHLDLLRKEFETKCLYMQDELDRVKKCSYHENQILVVEIAKLTDSKSSMEITFDNMKIEKDSLELKEKETAAVILSLEKELQRVKACAFEERQTLVAKDRNYNKLIEESKKNFKDQILARDTEISSLKLTLRELDDLKKSLESDTQKQHEKALTFEITVEKLENEKRSLEKNLSEHQQHILTLRESLNELQEIELALKAEAMQRDEALASMRKSVDMLQNENEQLQNEIVERNEKVSLFELHVSEFEKQKTALEGDMWQQTEGQNVLKVNVEALEKQKKSLEDNIVEFNNEISLLKGKVSQLEGERETMAKNIAVKDGTLTDVRTTVKKLEDEKNVLEENNSKKSNQVSLLETTIVKLEKEKECLANDIVAQNEALICFERTVEQLKRQNKDLEDNVKRRDGEILSLKENVSMLIQEKEFYEASACKKEEVLSGLRFETTKLHDDKEALQENLMKRDIEVPLLESKVFNLEKENECLVNDIANKDKELSVLKQTVEKFDDEKKVIEENNLNKDNEILLLETALVHLKKEKVFLTNDISQRDEELSACKEIMNKFNDKKNALEHDREERENEILLLKEEKESCVNDLFNKNEKLSAFDITVENFKNEKKAYEEDIQRRTNNMQLLESRLAQLQNEKESLINDVFKRDEELSVFKTTVDELQHEKRALEKDIVKQSQNMFCQEENLAKIEKEKRTISGAIAKRDEEMCIMKASLEKLEAEKKSLEDNVSKNGSEVLFLKEEIAKHQQEKGSFTDKLAKQGEELSILKITVDELHNEKTVFEDDLIKRGAEISSLELKVFNLQADKEILINEIAQKDEKLSAFVKNIEKLENEARALQGEMAIDREEVLSLRDNVEQISGAKTSLEIEIQNQGAELLSIKTNLLNLENENELLKNIKQDLSEKLSRRNGKINSYEEEINLLKTDLRKVKSEKESVQHTVKEMHEKMKCDEADFDQLVAGYLQEIDSWKKRFGALEEEMAVLRNKMERLQSEKKGLEITLTDMRESKRVSEENLQENIRDCDKEIDSLKLKVKHLESDAEILRKAAQELETEYESTKVEVIEINNEKEKDNKTLEELVANVQEMTENSEKQLLEKEEEIANLRLHLQGKLQMVHAQLENKEKELHGRIATIEQVNLEVNQLNEIVSEKEREISILRSKVSELEEFKLKAKNKLYEKEKQYDKKESELKRSLVYMEELREENEKFSKVVSEKEDNVFALENEIKELSKKLLEVRSRFDQEKEESYQEINSLRDRLKLVESKESEAKTKLNLMKDEINRLTNEISANKQRNLDDRNSEKSVRSDIEKSREQLRVLLADIDETSKIKLSLDKDLLALQSKLEQGSEEKTKLEVDVLCLKEITDELTKGKYTLLEEIARLSDQKKEGQELLNSEFSRLRKSNEELQKDREIIHQENSELVVQITSLKVTLATVQSAYEQAQDEVKNFKTRFEEVVRRESQIKQEREEQNNESMKLKTKITYLEEKNRSIIVDNQELTSSRNQTSKRSELLEKELQTAISENSLLLERLKQQQEGSDENLDGGKSSTQVSSLRKKVKEFRTKLSEEKKHRELHEFEIKNLREKVERFTKKEKEIELQLESNRKTLLEMKTERDGLLMDLDSVNKRKKKDMEGYASRIESLEDELRILKGKESEKVDGKQIKETVHVLNEEKKIFELKLTTNQERHQKEVIELKTTLESLQNRYTTELKRFEASETANQNEILTLRKSLTSMERENEIQGRELKKLRVNFVEVNSEKEKIQKILSEKNSEVIKWKKEAMNDKAEINFLRGSLNILEKEGFADKLPETRDLDTKE